MKRPNYSEDSSSSDGEAPEAVSLSTSKAEIISQIKSEREATRLTRELNRTRAIKVQQQNLLARQRKAKELEDAVEDSQVSQDAKEKQNLLLPLSEDFLSSAFSGIRKETEVETEEMVDSQDIQEILKQHRAKINKRRLIDTLPFSIVEVGSGGRSRISRAELKTRRNISKTKLAQAGSKARRIDSIIDRSRKGKAPAAVFHRQNSFY